MTFSPATPHSHFNTALNDLYGLVPKESRKHAQEYLIILQHVASAMSEQTEALRKIETAIYHYKQNAGAQVARIEEILNS